jgi:predicted SnoaL-like aldol condensation-catalyzing enzyme
MLMAPSFGLLSLFVAIFPTMYVAQNASGVGTEEATEQNGIKLARQVIEAFNTGDVSNVSQFISPQYFNHESQVDPVRGKLRGPEEFVDTIKNLRRAFPDIPHEEQAIIAQGDMVVILMTSIAYQISHVLKDSNIMPKTKLVHAIQSRNLLAKLMVHSLMLMTHALHQKLYLYPLLWLKIQLYEDTNRL